MPVADYTGWETELRRAGIGTGASELHGSITGFLCVGWGGTARELAAALALEGCDDRVDALLDSAAARISARLRNGEPVEILLPPGPVARRANAAVDWCRGLLGGLGLTGVASDRITDAATGKLLAQLADIASRHVAASDEDAAALAGVLQFIRVGVARLRVVFAPTEPP